MRIGGGHAFSVPPVGPIVDHCVGPDGLVVVIPREEFLRLGVVCGREEIDVGLNTDVA